MFSEGEVQTKKNEREREKARRFLPILRFDVGNHAPHSPSAVEIFGFIVCEGLSPNRGVLSRTQGRKKRSRET